MSIEQKDNLDDPLASPINDEDDDSVASVLSDEIIDDDAAASDDEPDDDDDDDDDEPEPDIDDENNPEVITTDVNNNNTNNISIDSDDDSDTDDEAYLQKFDDEIKRNYLVESHPEEISASYQEISALCQIVRNKDGIIVDDLHKTIPAITKYEYTSVLGTRAKQINAGAKPFVEIKQDIIDGYLIAQIELKQKKIPFIIKRPLPNGGCEYWKLSDLEILTN